MSGIEWNDDNVTGVAAVDDGNRAIFSQVNRIYDTMIDNRHHAEVSRLLVRLDALLRHHFRVEENEMAHRFGDAEAATFRAAHGDQLAELEAIAHAFATGGVIANKWLMRKRFIRWFARAFRGPDARFRALLQDGADPTAAAGPT